MHRNCKKRWQVKREASFALYPLPQITLPLVRDNVAPKEDGPRGSLPGRQLPAADELVDALLRDA